MFSMKQSLLLASTIIFSTTSLFAMDQDPSKRPTLTFAQSKILEDKERELAKMAREVKEERERQDANNRRYLEEQRKKEEKKAEERRRDILEASRIEQAKQIAEGQHLIEKAQQEERDRQEQLQAQLNASSLKKAQETAERDERMKRRREEMKREEEENNRQQEELKNILQIKMTAGEVKFSEQTTPALPSFPPLYTNELQKACLLNFPWFQEWIKKPADAQLRALLQPDNPMIRLYPKSRIFKEQALSDPLHPNYWTEARYNDKHKLHDVVSKNDPTCLSFYTVQEGEDFDPNRPYHRWLSGENPSSSFYSSSAEHTKTEELKEAWKDPHLSLFWTLADRHPSHPGYELLSQQQGSTAYLVNSLENYNHPGYDQASLTDPRHPNFLLEAWENPKSCLHKTLKDLYGLNSEND